MGSVFLRIIQRYLDNEFQGPVLAVVSDVFLNNIIYVLGGKFNVRISPNPL